MLNKYGKFWYAICTFQGVTSHQFHQNRNIGSQIFKYSKRSTQIQTIPNGSQIRRQGPILRAILFKAFPYFQQIFKRKSVYTTCNMLKYLRKLRLAYYASFCFDVLNCIIPTWVVIFKMHVILTKNQRLHSFKLIIYPVQLKVFLSRRFTSNSLHESL